MTVTQGPAQTTPAAGETSPPFRLLLLLGAGLVLAVAAVYAQVYDHGFVRYDDAEAITGNPGLRLGLSPRGLAWAFQTTLVANWIPLTVVSLLADAQLHGLDPRWVLLENVALHAASTVLLLHVFWRMTGAVWKSAAIAAVFAIHPLHVESVAWAAMRKDVLSGVFFMLPVWAHLRFTEKPGPGRQAVVALACTAGLLSKPTLVTLPFVLLLLDLWPLGRLTGPRGEIDARRLRSAVAEKIPLFALVALASVASVLAQSASGATVAADAFPLAARVANALAAVTDYLRTSVWPAGLAAFYPGPHDDLPIAKAFVGLLVVAGVAIAGLVQRRRRPWLLVGWLWFLGMLVPVLGLVQVGSQARADRYTYLPLIGLSILPIWAAAELAQRRPRLRGVITALAAVSLVAFAVGSFRQVGFWRDGVVLFERVLAVTRDNPVARAQLAASLEEQGRFEEAAGQLRAAVRLDPGLVPALNNLAWLLATHPAVPEAEHDEALALAARAVEGSGAMSPEPLFTLSVALARKGRFGDAGEAATRAAALARTGGNEPLARIIDSRIARYRAGRSD